MFRREGKLKILDSLPSGVRASSGFAPVRLRSIEGNGAQKDTDEVTPPQNATAPAKQSGSILSDLLGPGGAGGFPANDVKSKGPMAGPDAAMGGIGIAVVVFGIVLFFAQKP